MCGCLGAWQEVSPHHLARPPDSSQNTSVSGASSCHDEAPRDQPSCGQCPPLNDACDTSTAVSGRRGRWMLDMGGQATQSLAAGAGSTAAVHPLLRFISTRPLCRAAHRLG